MTAPASGGPWPILDLVRLAGGHRHGGVCGVFVCYLDDSDDKDSSVATLAGYVARLPVWERFEEEVAPIFDRYEVPIFHAKELHGTKGAETPKRPSVGRLARPLVSWRQPLLPRL